MSTPENIHTGASDNRLATNMYRYHASLPDRKFTLILWG